MANISGGVGVTVSYVQGTAWDFLVTFSVAEAPITASAPSNTSNTAMNPLPTVSMASPATMVSLVLGLEGNAGTSQYDPSIAMTSSGSFVEVWTQDTLTTAGYNSNTNLYFRTFQESTDTAGPLVTDLIDPATGNRLQAARRSRTRCATWSSPSTRT